MKSFISSLVAALISVTCVTIAAQANPTLYSGSLSWDSGLTATGDWADSSTKIEWWVDDTTTPGLWHYKYTLTVPQKGISHMIIEASDQVFTSDNLFNLTSNPAGWINGDPIIDTHNPTSDGGNPNMPGSMYGIKFEADDVQVTTVTIEFDSDRIPTYGDFYAKDGKATDTDIWNTVYNIGFLADDSSLNHIVVPDSLIPAPGALLLATTGIGFVAWLRRCRTL